MKRTPVGHFNTDTGEILEGVPIFAWSKRSPYMGWMMVNKDAMLDIAAMKNLPASAVRVFFMMAGRMEYENIVRVPRFEIARDLNMSRQQVWAATKLLLKEGMILSEGKIGNTPIYRIEPEIMWKGSVPKLEEFRRQRAERAIRHD